MHLAKACNEKTQFFYFYPFSNITFSVWIYDMWTLFLLSVTFLAFLCTSLACLPFISERNRIITRKLKRSLYEKGAKHFATFGAFFSLLLGILFVADYFANGLIATYFIRPTFMDNLFLGLAALYFVSGLCYLGITYTKKGVQNIFYKMNLILGTGQILGVIILLWHYLRATMFAPDWTLEHLWYQEPLQVPLIIFAITCLLMGLMGAHLLCLLFLIVRRNKDDYGRDYYNVLLKTHAQRACISGALFLVAILTMVLLMPLSTDRLHLLWIELQSFGLYPSMENISQDDKNVLYNNWKYYIIAPLAFLPIALLCLQRLSVTNLPLQKKSLVFISVIFIFLALICFLFRIWA